MKKIAFIILGIMLLPTLASAAAGGLLTGITDDCYEKGGCTFCDVVKVGTNIFNFLRNNIAFPIAVLFILYGGVMMIFAGGSKSQAETGKKVLMAALIGFAIVLCVSLILNSVLMILSKEKSDWKSFVNGSVECGIEADLEDK